MRVPNVAAVSNEILRQFLTKPVAQQWRFDMAFNVSHLENIDYGLVELDLFFELRNRLYYLGAYS